MAFLLLSAQVMNGIAGCCGRRPGPSQRHLLLNWRRRSSVRKDNQANLRPSLWASVIGLCFEMAPISDAVAGWAEPGFGDGDGRQLLERRRHVVVITIKRSTGRWRARGSSSDPAAGASVAFSYGRRHLTNIFDHDVSSWRLSCKPGTATDSLRTLPTPRAKPQVDTGSALQGFFYVLYQSPRRQEKQRGERDNASPPAAAA